MSARNRQKFKEVTKLKKLINPINQFDELSQLMDWKDPTQKNDSLKNWATDYMS